jgi:hypothetical protein
VAIDDMTTSTFYQRLLTNKKDWTWGAGDGAASRLAPNGATYWCFGDTIIGYPNPADTSFDSARIMVSNTILIQRGAELGPATFSGGVAAVPDVVMDGVPRRFWATDIIFPSVYPDKAFVLCQRTHTDVGFVTDGVMIAEFDMVGDGQLLFNVMHETPSTLNALETTEIQWAQGWDEKDGFIYVYGYRQDGVHSPYTTAHRSFAARVPVRQITNKYAWQFWNGTTGWIAGLTATALDNAKKKASIILDGQLTTIRYDVNTSRWLFGHKPNNGFGDHAQVLTSANPQGPLASSQIISSTGGTSPGGHTYITYNLTLHPKVTLFSGKYLVAISHNGTTFADIFSERTLYNPEFLEVTIP